MQDKFQKMKQKLDQLRAEYNEAAEAAFKDGAAHLFEQHPALQSFGWRQYTPYFNDGDACYFSAETDCPFIVFQNDERNDFYNDGSETPENKAGVAVCEFLDMFDSECLENLFGDHVEVSVSREGISKSQYSHE